MPPIKKYPEVKTYTDSQWCSSRLDPNSGFSQLLKDLCEQNKAKDIPQPLGVDSKGVIWNGRSLLRYIKYKTKTAFDSYLGEVKKNEVNWKDTANKLASEGGSAELVEIIICCAAQATSPDLKTFLEGYIEYCVEEGWIRYLPVLGHYPDLVQKAEQSVLARKPSTQVNIESRTTSQVSLRIDKGSLAFETKTDRHTPRGSFNKLRFGEEGELNSKELELLRTKLETDFGNGILENFNFVKSEIDNVKSELFKSNFLTSHRDIRLPIINIFDSFLSTDDPLKTSDLNSDWYIYNKAWDGQKTPRDETLKAIGDLGKIKVGTSSFSPAVETSLIHLKKLGINISIDSEAKHGIDQIISLENRGSLYDFLITADANLFSHGEVNSEDFRYLMPIFRHPHYFVERSAVYGGEKILTFGRGTSGEQLIKLGRVNQQFKNMRATDVDIDSLPSIVENLELKQVALVWDPISSSLAGNKNYICTKAPFDNSQSLYCHKDLWPLNKQRPIYQVAAFIEAFIDSWNYLKGDIAYSALILGTDKNYKANWKFLMDHV